MLFRSRAEALLGEQVDGHTERAIPAMLPQLDRDVPSAGAYKRPAPNPSPELRKVKISATALDRLLGDPYQFYAKEILKLKRLDPLAADPFSDPALRGTLVHDIMENWHKARETQPDLPLIPFAEQYLRDEQVHPLFWGLWRPRITAALEKFEQWIEEDAQAGRAVIATEVWGEMKVDGVKVFGRPDRIDRLADGTLAIVDYKSGKPPSKNEVSAGFRLQLGVLGLIARDGSFKTDQGALSGETSAYEFWSLKKAKDGAFGEKVSPLKLGTRETGLLPEEFLPQHEEYLRRAIANYINGTEPFTAKENPNYPGYDEYDQLMRLSEWLVHQIDTDAEDAA